MIAVGRRSRRAASNCIRSCGVGGSLRRATQPPPGSGLRLPYTPYDLDFDVARVRLARAAGHRSARWIACMQAPGRSIARPRPTSLTPPQPTVGNHAVRRSPDRRPTCRTQVVDRDTGSAEGLSVHRVSSSKGHAMVPLFSPSVKMPAGRPKRSSADLSVLICDVRHSIESRPRSKRARCPRRANRRHGYWLEYIY